MLLNGAEAAKTKLDDAKPACQRDKTAIVC
jgi:hypothetical protein